MTISYPLDPPLEEFSEVDVEPIDVNEAQIATFTGQDRVQQFEGDYWKITVRYRNLDVTLGRPVTAFVQALRKSIGTFVVEFPGYGQPLGAAAGLVASPLVDGASQAGNRVLNIKNATASTAGWLLAGDIMQVGPDTRPHWHTVLTDVTTDGTGKASIDIWPALRRDVANNDPIVLTNPRGLCRLVSSTVIQIRPPVLYDLVLECREKTGP